MALYTYSKRGKGTEMNLAVSQQKPFNNERKAIFLTVFNELQRFLGEIETMLQRVKLSLGIRCFKNRIFVKVKKKTNSYTFSLTGVTVPTLHKVCNACLRRLYDVNDIL